MDKGWKIWPTKIVPITSPRMTSDRPGTGPDDDSRGNDISDDDDDDGDQRRRTSESRGGRKVRKLSQPPPPKQPPPSYGNGGRRSGRNPPLRSSGNNGGGGAGGRGGGVARKDIDIPRERSGARVEKIVDIEDKPTNHEEDYDVWKQHDEDSSGRGGGDGGRVRIGRRRSSDVDWEGRLPRDRRQGRKSVAGNATATLSLLQPRDELSDDNRDPRQRGKNARQEFQHLSSDERWDENGCLFFSVSCLFFFVSHQYCLVTVDTWLIFPVFVSFFPLLLRTLSAVSDFCLVFSIPLKFIRRECFRNTVAHTAAPVQFVKLLTHVPVTGWEKSEN